ncbi:MAG: hypothetical protein K2M94_06420 [Paramuribaculum sp.]|nr:hypothetical protein [Paramuribaculum sp.]
MKQKESKLDLRRYIQSIVRYKWIFIGMMSLFIFAGIFLAIRSLPKYRIEGEVLIGETSKFDGSANGNATGMSSMMKSFSGGGFGSAAVNNELMIMNSHDVMLRAVKMLGLNRLYYAKDKDGDRSQLYNDSPVIIDAPVEYFDTLSTSFTIKVTILDSGKVNLKAMKGMFNRTIAEKNEVTLPTMFKTPLGSLQVMATELFEGTDIRTINTVVNGNDIAANLLQKKISVTIPEKLAEIINVQLIANNKEYGMAVVNGVMGEYNTKRLKRIHESARTAIKYYDDRIAETFDSLQKAERQVSDYQRQNALMGIDSELGLLVGTAVSNRGAIRSAHYNIAYYETVLDILRNRLNDDVIIPAVESLNDAHVADFNEAIVERRNLRRSATEDNKALILLNERITRLRDIIIENSEKQLAKHKADLKHQEELAADAQGRLDEYPEFQLELKNISRNLGTQNSLYYFLINSRQNAVLQLYSETTPGWVYQPAYMAKKPNILSSLMLPTVFILLGLFCCCGLALLLTWFRKKISTPADLAFIKSDKNCVIYSGDRNQLNTMRQLLIKNENRRLIYTADITGEHVTPLVTEPLLNIDRSVEIIRGMKINDSLLTPDFDRQITSALATADFVIVEIPDPENVCDLELEIDRRDAQLVIGIESKTVKRSTLKKILRGQTASRVFTFLFGK